MDRRTVMRALAGLAGFAALPLAQRQQAPKYQLGYLSPGPMTVNRRGWLERFRDHLRALGYADGQIVIDARWADSSQTFDVLAGALVHSNPDVIVAVSGPAVLAAKNATTRVPIIFAAVPDPLGSGIIDRLGRPSANVTGVSLGWDADFVGKWLASIKELLPNAKRLALLWSSPETTIPLVETTRGAARKLNMSVDSFDLRDANGLDSAFRAMKANAVDGVFVFSNPFTVSHQARIVALAASHRIPGFYGNADFVAAGGLAGYSANFGEQIRRAANFVDRILKGARPGDLPVEQPRTFELAINLRTAKLLRLTVPQSLLVRADRVIE